MNEIRPVPRAEAWSVEEFLAWEDRQESRHEFDGTDIIAMTGGSRAHQRIVLNLMFALMRHLDPEHFDAVQEMRLRVGRRVRYPDVSVTVGRIPQTAKTLHDAVVVFDVLSDDTEDTDRVTKLAEYAEVPGLRAYVLLRQDAVGGSVQRRASATADWVEQTIPDAVELPEIGVTLPLAEVYAGLSFAGS